MTDVSFTSIILIGCVSNPRKFNLSLTIFTSRVFQFTSNDSLLVFTVLPFKRSTKLSNVKFLVLAPLAFITILSLEHSHQKNN